uniref:Uncharacterized protein n=1 Tax=Anguilla anguilla TaxID=7936 RepID=A0A0E9UXE9_ANGAN
MDFVKLQSQFTEMRSFKAFQRQGSFLVHRKAAVSSPKLHYVCSFISNNSVVVSWVNSDAV